MAAGSNLYIIGTNLFDNATLVATSEATGYDKENMQLDTKSSVWRSTNLSEQTITATWGTTQTLSAIAFAFSNLHTDSTVQLKLYTNSGDPSPVLDTGVLTVDYSYSAPYGLNTIGLDSFAYGGGTYFSSLFAETDCKEIKVIINSGGNPDGYMEISRIIAGLAYTPEYGASYGIEEKTNDSAIHIRPDSGNLASKNGVISKGFNLTLGALNQVDRHGLTAIARGRGLSVPVFASLYENSENRQERQAHMIYGVFNQLPGLSLFMKDKSSTNFNITEI